MPAPRRRRRPGRRLRTSRAGRPGRLAPRSRRSGCGRCRRRPRFSRWNCSSVGVACGATPQKLAGTRAGAGRGSGPGRRRPSASAASQARALPLRAPARFAARASSPSARARCVGTAALAPLADHHRGDRDRGEDRDRDQDRDQRRGAAVARTARSRCRLALLAAVLHGLVPGQPAALSGLPCAGAATVAAIDRRRPTFEDDSSAEDPPVGSLRAGLAGAAPLRRRSFGFEDFAGGLRSCRTEFAAGRGSAGHRILDAARVFGLSRTGKQANASRASTDRARDRAARAAGPAMAHPEFIGAQG